MLDRKTKTRSCRFTDAEWKAVKEASDSLGYATTASFLREVVMKEINKGKKK